MQSVFNSNIIYIVGTLLAIKYFIQAFFSYNNSKQSIKIEGKPRIHSTIVFLIGFILFIIFVFKKENSSFAFFALPILLLGLIIGIWGIINLNKNYNDDLIIYQNSSLVKNGIYSLTRHPIRLGICLETISLALLIGSVYTIPLLLTYLYLNHKRTCTEEQFLINNFQQEATEYLASVPRYNLLKGIYKKLKRPSVIKFGGL